MEKKVTSVRLSIQLIEDIKELAATQNRSSNNFIETVLLNEVNKHQKEKENEKQ